MEHHVGEVISTGLGICSSSVKRQLSYAFKFENTIRDLRDELDKVEGQRERIQHAVDEALRQGDQIERLVKDWQTRCDRSVEEARILVQEAENHQSPQCRPSLKRQWRLGRRATKQVQGLTKLLEETVTLHPVSFPHSFRPIIEPPGFMPSSRTQSLELILEYLSDPERKKVGIHGMGGAGKTFMAKQLMRKIKERNLFDKVVMVAISHAPDISKIRKEIAGQMDLRLDDESEAVNQSRLYFKLMEEKRVLIILDDIWKSVELDEIGIPDKDTVNSSKILMISRRKDVLESMGSSSSNNISLELLSVDEAMDLFKQKVGEHNLERAKQIVLKCDGHPLSLVAMGDLLKNKGRHVWDDIINQLSNIPGERIQDKVLTRLEMSYKYLNEEQKSFFLLCGLLGQAEISSLVLLKYCWGLGLFRGVCTVVDAWNRLLTLIDNLIDTSLIVGFNKDDGLITIHDMVRDTAAFIATKDHKAFTIRSDSEFDTWSGDTLLDDSCPWMFLSNVCEFPRSLDCSNLKFFMFQAVDHNVSIPNYFFKQSTNLQVVALAKITTVLPKSLESLKNLRTLCLHDCILSDVSFIGNLEKMEVLSFRGSNLQGVPRELGQLKCLKVLDLHNCIWLTTFPESVLPNLYLLEELYMGHTSVEWDTPGNAHISELAYLCHLTTLEIQFPVGKTMPEGVCCGNLKRFRIGFSRKHSLDRLHAGMKTLLLPNDSVLPGDLEALLSKTEVMEIGNLRGMKNAHFGMHIDVLDNLRSLFISKADDLEHVVCSNNSDLCVFPQLETLQLVNIKKFKSICNRQLSTGSFSRLKTLEVVQCDSLKYVFSLSSAECLERLESLKIGFCNNIEEIIYVENDNNTVANHSLNLPSLVNLELLFLPCLRCFMHTGTSPSQPSSGEPCQKQPLFNNKVLLPLLESLSLHGLPKVMDIWADQLDEKSFFKLKHLDICLCSCLQIVFQAAVSKRFMALSKLEIKNCEMLKEIYEFPKEEEAEEEKVASFEFKLTYISLAIMPKLQSIWGNNHSKTFLFPDLEYVSISWCLSLKAVFPSPIASPIVNLKVLHLELMGFKGIVPHDEYSGSPPCISFPQLTSLKLEYRPTLEVFNRELVDVEVPKFNSCAATLDDPQGLYLNAMFFTDTILCNLTELSINGNLFKIITESPRLKELISKVRSLVLFTLADNSLIAPRFFGFSGLEKLYIRDSKVQTIFTNDGHGEGSLINTSNPLRILKLEKITFMETLTLLDPLLKLEELELRSCCDVMRISTTSFKNLSILTIDRCDKMVAMLPFSIAKTMEQLVKMTISYCSSLNEVVCDEEGQLVDEGAQLCVTFSRLKSLVLDRLSSLACFCSAKFMIQFPSLEEVTVVGCPNMEIFSRGTVTTPKLKNVRGTPWQCAADLNSTISKMYTEMIGIRDLEEISLSKCPQLTEKWHGKLGFKLCAWLQKMIIDNCASSQVSLPLKHFQYQSLGWKLIIQNCETMEEIFYLEGIEASRNRAVALISSLTLNNLPNLRSTWNETLVDFLRFESLTHLNIGKCDSLKNVFTVSSASFLSNLEYLTIERCASLRVILMRGGEEGIDWDGHIWFPSLKSLKLLSLPSLESFYASNHVFKIHSLRIINVTECPMLSVFDSTGSSDIQRLFNGQVEIGKKLEDIRISVT